MSTFTQAFEKKQREIYTVTRANGWWDGERNDGELIALMHSELSEALEALRNGNGSSEKIPGFNAVEEELADVVIRIMDYAAGRGLRLAEAIEAKMVYNEIAKQKYDSSYRGALSPRPVLPHFCLAVRVINNKAGNGSGG